MPRTSNIYVRIEPEIKKQAETVLEQLGIPMSNAIGLFLRQVVLQQGIPFDMKLRVNKQKEMSQTED
jgi:DNA-damage-inducible protein J